MHFYKCLETAEDTAQYARRTLCQTPTFSIAQMYSTMCVRSGHHPSDVKELRETVLRPHMLIVTVRFIITTIRLTSPHSHAGHTD